jgi:DNA-binding HxlR family transcriptional regulator
MNDHDTDLLAATSELADDLHFIMLDEAKPPPRIAQARERLLLCRLYVGLIRSIHEDYGAEFVGSSDSCTLRTIGIYVFLRTLMCTPVRASTIAQTLKLPKTVVNRRLQEMMKHGYVERVGNAYRMTDKVNIPDLQDKLQHRIDMILQTASELSKLRASEVAADGKQTAAAI